MSTPHKISNSSNIRSGNAQSADRTKNGMPQSGEEAQPFLVLHLGSPIIADADGLGASQTVTGAGTAFVLDGALAGSPDADGVVTLDVPRGINAAWTNTAVLTIRGYDQYGALVVETSASGTSHTGKKAFKKIISVKTSATITSATVGTNDVLGLPYAPVIGGFLSGIANENTADAGTYVAPDRTDPATGTTGNVRGTYDPAGTLDGSLKVAVRVALQNGPNDSDLFGVAQYSG